MLLQVGCSAMPPKKAVGAGLSVQEPPPQRDNITNATTTTSSASGSSCDCDCARAEMLELGIYGDPRSWGRCPCQCCPDQQGQLHGCTIMVHVVVAEMRRVEEGGSREDAFLERPFCDHCEEHRRTDGIPGALKRRRTGPGREGAASDGHGWRTDDPGQAQKARRVS